MDRIIVALERIKSITSSQQAVMNATLPMVRGDLEDLQALQMLDGLTRFQEPIEPEYSPRYAKNKGFKTPNLHKLGNFQRGITVKVDGENLVWDSTDSKTERLESKYKDIFGLGGPYLQQGQEYIKEEFASLIKATIHS